MAGIQSENYNYDTVDELLEAAGRRRGHHYHVDHIVELQLVKEAFNMLKKSNYSSPDRKDELIAFFNDERNLQFLLGEENGEKGRAVSKLIRINTGKNRKESLTQSEKEWVKKIKKKWKKLRKDLHGKDFSRFEEALERLLIL